MNMSIWQRPTAIWILLIVATLAGFGTAGVGGVGFAIVMLVAAFKAWLIAGHFMELRSAPLAWRLTFGGLIGISTVVIIGLHFLVFSPYL